MEKEHILWTINGKINVYVFEEISLFSKFPKSKKRHFFKSGNFDKNSDNSMEKIIEHFGPFLIKIYTLCTFIKKV
jgi:hypothetical protein